MECVGTGQPNTHCGRRSGSAATAPNWFRAGVADRQGSRCGLPLVPLSHIAMMPEKGSPGNLDPSRGLALGSDNRVAGRGDPIDLRDSAGADDWRRVAVADERRRGRRSRNSAGRDHSADKSRTLRDIRSRIADAESLRHEGPCRSRRGWTTAADHGSLEGITMRGDPLQGCQPGILPLLRPGPHTLPPSREGTPFQERTDDRTEDCACGADDDVIYIAKSSKRDDFR